MTKGSAAAQPSTGSPVAEQSEVDGVATTGPLASPEGLELGPPRPETAALRAEIAAARDELATELDDLDRTARETLDPRALARRNAGKLVAGAGAAGFVVAGGPGRLRRAIGRALRGGKPPTPRSVLPEEIERIVADMGPDAQALRSHLGRAFADYLERRQGTEPTAARSLWRFVDAVSLPVARAIVRQATDRLVGGSRSRARPRGGQDEQT